MFQTFSDWTVELSLTPCFSWVFGSHDEQNRFNGLLPGVETVETVPTVTRSPFTQLKRGVNEKIVESSGTACEISELTARAANFVLRFGMDGGCQGRFSDRAAERAGGVEAHLPEIADRHSRRRDEPHLRGLANVLAGDFEDVQEQGARVVARIADFDSPGTNGRPFPSGRRMIVLPGFLERMSPRFLAGTTADHDLRVLREQRSQEHAGPSL